MYMLQRQPMNDRLELLQEQQFLAKTCVCIIEKDQQCADAQCIAFAKSRTYAGPVRRLRLLGKL